MTATDGPLLEVEGLDVRYPGGGVAVSDASFELHRGEILVVVGANGAGKTSLVRGIAGFLPSEGVSTQGKVRLSGKSIRGKDPARIARRGLCFIPERNKIFRGLSVETNLKLFASRRRTEEGLDDDLRSAFQMFPWMEGRRSALAGYLSGGQQQMLALSGVLLARPDLVIVDEPSQGLAPVIVQQVMDRLRRLRDELGAAILLVDQNVASTVPLADRVQSMHGGVLSEEVKSEVLARAAKAGYARSDEPAARR